jgi:hypothetical protein
MTRCGSIIGCRRVLRLKTGFASYRASVDWRCSGLALLYGEIRFTIE